MSAGGGRRVGPKGGRANEEAETSAPHDVTGLSAGGAAGRSHRPSVIVLTAAAVLPILIPYATIVLPFRTGLVVQAAVICGAVLAVGWTGIRKGDVIARVASCPRSIAVALLLYTLAGAWGAVVGGLRGNDPVHLVGQTVSMGLLPAAAVAALALGRRDTTGPLLTAVATAVSLAVVAHLVHWATEVGRGEPLNRLYMPNNVASVGPSLLALLAACALAATPGPRWRRLLGAVAGGLALVYVVGSGVRSLWLVAPPAALLCLVFLRPSRTVRRRIVGAAVAVAASLILLMAAGQWWWARERPDLLAAAAHSSTSGQAASGEPGRRTRPVTVPPAPGVQPIPQIPEVAVRGGHTYLVRTVARGFGSRGRCVVMVQWLDERGRVLRDNRSTAMDTGRFHPVKLTSVAPRTATRARIALGCTGLSDGHWRLTWPSVQRLGPRQVVAVFTQLDFLHDRILELADMALHPGGTPELSVSMRLAETRALLRRVEDAHGGTLLLGHGLGAVYRVPPPGNGVAPPGHPVSYVHNFYLFLLFKLGLVGTVLVIASLALFTTSPLLRLLRGAGTGSRPVLAVAVATWVGYAVWSVACPMILDFHVAPLLGLVVAAASRPPADGQVGAELRGDGFRPPREPHVLP